MPRIIEFDSESADEFFDETPEYGDKIFWNGREYFIEGIDIINQSKMVVKICPHREIQRFEDPSDYSVGWEKLPERFLENDENCRFLDDDTFKGGSNQ